MSARLAYRVAVDQALSRQQLLELTCAAWLADASCITWLPLDRGRE